MPIAGTSTRSRDSCSLWRKIRPWHTASSQTLPNAKGSKSDLQQSRGISSACGCSLQRNIQRMQMQLAGLSSCQDLRLEMVRLLADYHADLKTWDDRNSKDYPQQWYNTTRLSERNHAQKLLNKAKSTQVVCQQDLMRNWTRLGRHGDGK